MATKNDEVTTWYAFQCPKTEREYFYEPISGEKTWSLPTSKHIINTQRRAPVKHPVTHQASASDKQGAKMRIEPNQPTKLGVVVAMTLLVSLICNTVFLIALVKFTGPHDMAVNDIFDVVTEEEYNNPLNTSAFSSVTIKVEEYDGISGDNLVKEEESDEAYVPEESLEESNAEDLSDIELKDKPQESDIKQRAQADEGASAQENDAVVEQKNDQTEHIYMNGNNDQDKTLQLKSSVHHTNESREESKAKPNKERNKDPFEIPPQCWVPFAYVFNPRCRRNENTGLKKPMFDAEQFVRAMI